MNVHETLVPQATGKGENGPATFEQIKEHCNLSTSPIERSQTFLKEEKEPNSNSILKPQANPKLETVQISATNKVISEFNMTKSTCQTTSMMHMFLDQNVDIGLDKKGKTDQYSYSDPQANRGQKLVPFHLIEKVQTETLPFFFI